MKNNKGELIDIFYTLSELKFYILQKYNIFPINILWPHNNVKISTQTLRHLDLPTSLNDYRRHYKDIYNISRFLMEKENQDKINIFIKDELAIKHNLEDKALWLLSFINTAKELQLELSDIYIDDKNCRFGLLYLALTLDSADCITQLQHSNYNFNTPKEYKSFHENGVISTQCSSVFCLTKFNFSRVLENLNIDFIESDSGKKDFFENGNLKSHTTSFFKSISHKNTYLLDVFLKNKLHEKDTGYLVYDDNKKLKQHTSTLFEAASNGSRLIEQFPNIIFEQDIGQQIFYNNGALQTHESSLYIAAKHNHLSIMTKKFISLSNVTLGYKTFSEDSIEISHETVNKTIQLNTTPIKYSHKKLKKLGLISA
jgi:hypothetical protein